MGKVLSSIKHPFRNFNLESRAHKVISQPKPKPAPKHTRDQIEIERLIKEYSDVYHASLKKNALLDERLKDVFVVADDPPPIIQPQNPSRPLPSDRSPSEPNLFGIKEPDIIPKGKTTLRNALQFLGKHQGDPNNYTAERIANDYCLPEHVVKNLLMYYRVFELYVPEQLKGNAKFAKASIPKVYIIHDIKKLPSGNLKKDET
ncbi:protein NDUFAF4 homolog [Cylas formicarius]|uniref:protein NDUFAF4 homolog n=1 Tax=Cylas formicarius TaxID=197179 RepID=UPI002958CDAF|nr:protein NDUFAF4 homolog [Cylas formicarius]